MVNRFVICIKNDEYPASLEVRKIYRAMDDDWATRHNLIRVIDESNEDYLYPVDYFLPIELPASVVEAFSLAA
jgi:hypothetical protein